LLHGRLIKTKKQFKEALAKGLGSAIMYLQRCSDPTQYHDIVLWACLRNTCYDPQCEGFRSWYLFKAIELVGDKDSFETASIAKFSQNNLEYWLSIHFMDMLFRFAEEGSERAENALRNKANYFFITLPRMRKYSPSSKPRETYEYLLVWLLDLYGFDYFKYLSTKLGSVLISCKKRNVFQLDWFYASAQTKFGKDRIEKYLRKASQKSDAILAFYCELKKLDAESSDSPDDVSLGYFIDLAMQGADTDKKPDLRRSDYRLCRKVSKEEMNELAERALAEEDSDIKANLLLPFTHIDFPLEFEHLIPYTNKTNERLQAVAMNVLARFKSNSLYELAIEKLKSRNSIHAALDLLANNYHCDDEDLIYEVIKSIPLEEQADWHGIYIATEDVFTLNMVKPKTEALLYMYHHTLCSFCMDSIVRTMHKLKALPDEILHECQFDCNSDLVAFSNKVIKAKNKSHP
jgi:hypothetical protein